MVPGWRQLRLLLWKDYLIRRRKLVTLFGIVWACLVVGSLWVVRINIDNQYNPTCQYAARALPSAGMLTFLQSFICNIDNRCTPLDQYQDIPTYENSRFTQIRKQFSPILFNDTVIDIASAVPDALKLLATLTRVVDEPTFINVAKNGIRVRDVFVSPQRVRRYAKGKLFMSDSLIDNVLTAELNFAGIFSNNLNKCNGKTLSSILLVEQAVLDELSERVCGLSSVELQKVLFDLLPEINFSKYIKMFGDILYRINNDDSLSVIADSVTAALRMSSLDSFIPTEMYPFLKKSTDEFHYFNLTLIPKLLDLFEPTFGNTESYKAIRELADGLVSGIQWLHKMIIVKRHNAVDDVNGLVLNAMQVPGLEAVGAEIQEAVGLIGGSGSGDTGSAVNEVFHVLSKTTTFIMKYLPKQTQHDMLLYSTLLTKLIEGAHRVVLDNIRIEWIVYNVSARNMEAVSVLSGLPSDVLSHMFDALTDASRIELLTSKINDAGKLFCDEKKLSRFLQLPPDVVANVKSMTCNDVWKKYINDLINSFGISDVKNNINAMASILIQETIGKDTSSQLYTIDKDFEVLNAFTQDLIKISSESRAAVDWGRLFNATDDAEIMKVIKTKQNLGKLILITVHGAFAREIVKQNTILEIKITPVLVDATAILVALNGQLAEVPRALVADFKNHYSDILSTMLLTLLDENRTLTSLSTYAVDIFCNGIQNSTKYLIYPESTNADAILNTLCGTAKEIERALTSKSVIGKAIKKVMTTKTSSMNEIDWIKLISNFKNLYKTLQDDYPYIFDYTSYGVADRDAVGVLIGQVKEYWFGKSQTTRTVQLSLKFILQLLDLLDQDIFNIQNDRWHKLKYVVDSANGYLIIIDQIVKLFIDLHNNSDAMESELPHSSVIAMKSIVPNMPRLFIDVSDIIDADDTDIEPIIKLMNEAPQWPCSNTSISDYLALTNDSVNAVKGMERIFCMDRSFQKEWIEYIHTQNVKINMSITKANTTIFTPHLFLKFSLNFGSIVRDVTTLRAVLEDVMSNNTSEEKPSIVTAWSYVTDLLKGDNGVNKIRSLLNKIDTVLNSISPSSIENTPLYSLWRAYLQCNNGSVWDRTCRDTVAATWRNMIKFSSVIFEQAALDLLNYFDEVTDQNANLLQMVGFTRSTGLFILYDKLADFAAVLLNSYWDYGFMNQIRRASKSEFWDCEAVVDALVIPPGSRVTYNDVNKLKPYVCPSLIYWISLPTGENAFLNVIAKPQYYFYSIPASNLTSAFESAYNNMRNLTELIRDVSNKNITIDKGDIDLNTIGGKFEVFIDNIMSWKLNNSDASYLLFNEVNKKQFISSVYLTRIVVIVNKIYSVINDIEVNGFQNGGDVKQLEAELNAFQRIFKRRPSEAISIHFDIITELLLINDFNITSGLDSMCNNINKNRNLLNEGERVKNQICSKNYKLFYANISLDEEFKMARQSLLALLDSLQNNLNNDTDLFEFLNERKELITSLKLITKYADDLGLPVYLKYLHSNLRHYNVILSFLSGIDWWHDLKSVYDGPNAAAFFDLLENTLDITEHILTHLDKIHLVRLIRDMNVNSTEMFCMDNITLSDYIPDSTSLLTKFKTSVCHHDRIQLFKELPQLVIASQGFDSELKLSRDLDYKSIEQDLIAVENKLVLIHDGPKTPQTPFWMTDERLQKLKMAAVGLLSRESITKVTFGIISNVVDGSILFLNNSHCPLCSTLTTWFKQLNLQLFKKQEYDNLLCHLNKMTYGDIYYMLKDEFHWDMAIKELISTRNYTRYELNKSINEFLEQLEIHLIEDILSNSTKLSQCLASNVTSNASGNASLFLSVVSNSLILVDATMPHVKDIEGIKKVPFIEQLATDVIPKLHVTKPLRSLLKNTSVIWLRNDIILDHILDGEADLLLLKSNPNASLTSWLKLYNMNWTDVCNNANCTQITMQLNNALNHTQLNNDLKSLQHDKFWSFSFISEIIRSLSDISAHLSRLLGVASKMDVSGIVEGRLLSVLDSLLQLIQEDVLNDIIFSLDGILKEFHPLFMESEFEYDLLALKRGLQVVNQFRYKIVSNNDFKVHISPIFGNPDRLEFELSALGINNTNFWSLAAPRIHAGYVDLKPLLTLKSTIQISSFVCQSEDMSKIIKPADIDVVTLEDVYGAVVEQFCGLPDERVKEIMPVIFQNLNFTYIFNEVIDTLLTQVYSSSNLTREDGATVISKLPAMVSLLPTIQDSVGNLTDTLAKEPMFEAFKKFDTLGGLLSSAEFLSSAGNMLCGKPFVGNTNRFYKTIAETEDFNNFVDPLQLESLPTDYCRDLYRDVIRMNGGKIIWNFIKPLIMGKILFTPETPAVVNIIRNANATFAQMSKLTSILQNFASSFDSIKDISEHKEGVAVLRNVLQSEAFKQLSKSLLNSDNDSFDISSTNIDIEDIFDSFDDFDDIGKLLTRASNLLGCINLNRFHAMADEDVLTNEAVKLTRVNEFSAGLVFTNISHRDNVPINVVYKIRMDIDSVPTTTRLRNQFWTPGPEASFLEDMRYFRGFIQIQDMIDKAIILSSRNASVRVRRDTSASDYSNWSVYTQQMPYPCYMRDFFQSSLYESQALIVAFFFAFIMTVASAVRFIVVEKETGNTLLMSIMGVRLHNHTLSWFLSCLLEMVVTVSCAWLVLRVGGVVPRSDGGLLWLLLANYGLSLLMFCYLISKFFTSASVASVCACLFLLFSFMPYVIILSLEASLSVLQKILTCLSMSTAFSYSMLLLGRYEAIGTGLQWKHVWSAAPGEEGVNVATTAFMVLIDSVLYLLIGSLIDRYFGIKTLRTNITKMKTTSEKAGVSILNVTKVYGEKSRKPKVALDNVSIELHQGQITTLLGQNGAGKTTLIKIITGMLKPTKGSVVIRSDASLLSNPGVGVCPQHDVLFHNLTAYEHLCLYHQLKLCAKDDSYLQEVQSMLEILSLGALAHEQTHRLSGGLRRRLCVALAFISNPGLVLLDEPSSGVDPVARRDIWSLIMKLKNQRTVFLTTHHLDEAELLSDQIVIMHKGQIHTIGSPVEIKRSLGNGYKLIVSFPERNPRSLQDMKHITTWDDDEDGQTIDMEEKSKTLLTTVREVIKNAQLADVCDTLVEITLPFFDVQGLNNNFLELFSTLERRQSSLEYRDLTVECDSLEQVMSNICNQQPPEYTHNAEQFDIPSKSGSSSSLQNDVTPLVPADGPIRATHWTQYCALLQKRWTHYTRNRWLLLLLLVLPTLFVTISMGFSLIRPPYDNEISLKLHPDIYKDATKFIVLPNTNTLDSRLSSFVLDSIMNKNNTVRWTAQHTPQCECGDYMQLCDASGNRTRQDVVLPDAETLNRWIVSTQYDYIERRYGGWSSSLKENTSNLVAWYNNKGHHAMPAFVNQLNTHIMKAISGRKEAEITTHTHPLKISHEQLSKSTLLQHVADVGISGMLLLAYSLIPAGAAIYVVNERATQQKRLQLLSGVQPTVYWLAALTWDMFIIILNIILTACVLLAFNLPVFVDRHNLPAICLLLFLFGFSGTSFAHLLEKLFSESSMANMILFCTNVFSGASGLAVLLIMDIIAESDSTIHARWVLHKIFLLSPQFALGDALVEIAKNTVQAQVLSRFGMDTYASPLETSLVGYHITALILVGLLLCLANLAIENYWFDGILRRLYKESINTERGDEMEDLEVSAERRRVESSLHFDKLRISTIGRINAGYVDSEGTKQSVINTSDDVAACVRVSKTYRTASGKRTAVSGLSLAIPRGQCTALLGENGAGKSSTFSMLCGELIPTRGKIILNQSAAKRKDLCSGYVSYCPQSDAIDPLLTVRETLMFYCKLRGIRDGDEVIKRTVAMFDLSKYTEYYNMKLSGGNKRKLSTAIAFMGRSTLILLDEPTSGMDPGSRVCVWRGVRSCRGGGRGVLLSTHVLIDVSHTQKVAILSKGTLTAVSSTAQSRHKWCGGYVVQCRIGSETGSVAWRCVLTKLPHAKLRALHVHSMQFLVPTIANIGGKQCRTELSDIFRAMAALQGECDIEDYTVTESSLDQMFLSDKEDAVIVEALPTRIHDADNITAL